LTERIYLDTNVYCRPLDDQSDVRIRRETAAFLEIAERASHDGIQILSSDYVRFEIEQIQDLLKRRDVRGFERTLSVTSIKTNHLLRSLARDVTARCGVNALDALHISAACFGEAQFLVTCDDEVLGKRGWIEELVAQRGYRLKVRNPIEYLQERWEVEI